jgi:uncharacterized membrane protein YdjX (TVP38/TMEM64 family)
MHRHSHSSAETTPSVRVPGLFSWGKIFGLALVAIAVIAALFLTEFDWEKVPHLLERVNRPWALVVMAILPIVGFPISAVYLASGALFGPWIGGVVVTAVTLIHVFVTHVLARTVLRHRIEHWHKKWRRRLPEVPVGESATLVSMIVIVPGLPYLARNCLLVFSGVPLRYLLGVAVPLYVARSYVTIFLGDLGNDPSRRALLILATVFAAKLAVSALLFLRLKHRARRTGT